MKQTKIIVAFPCMGKTTYVSKYPEKAIDLESSHYLFLRDGYEHLSDEAFKGIEDRVTNPNGLTLYLEAIDNIMNEGKVDYLFIAVNKEIIQEVLEKGYPVIYIKPFASVEGYAEFEKRARRRGNPQRWITNTVKWLGVSPEDSLSSEFHPLIRVFHFPPHYTLEDALNELEMF